MRFLAPILRPILFVIVWIIDAIEGVSAASEHTYKLLLIPGLERVRWGIGVWRAWRNFYRAYATTPAYMDFIDEHGGRPRIHVRGFLPDLTVIPETDKESYVKTYRTEARVKYGTIPYKGVMVDESSGSSGQPTSWVRGPLERSMTKQMLQLSFHNILTGKKVFVLNAFALGAWATGLNVSLSLTDISIIKSTGPNLDKIVNTMLEFGPRYHYLITGYPPFLKTLVDDKRIDWSTYSADAVYGGEGISESLRTYLMTAFKRVLGSYGASDLEINMAGENDLTIRLRRAILEDADLRKALTKVEYGVTPMIFQYNPLAYYLETNAKGEIVATLSRPYNIAPKVRYNIHDRGHVLRYGALKKILRELGKSDILASNTLRIDLPLLFIYGRSDMSIEYYGAKVTPDSIREIIFGLTDLAPRISTFKLISSEDAHHNKRMEIAVELVEGAEKPKGSTVAKSVFEKLGAVNGDFYNALNHTATSDNLPELTFHAFNTGPFEGGQKKLKNEYVTSKLKYDAL